MTNQNPIIKGDVKIIGKALPKRGIYINEAKSLGLVNIKPKKAPLTVLKPKIAKLAKEYGGVGRLAIAIGMSQAIVSKVIYHDVAISDRMAKAISELTEGKLSFKSLKKMGPKDKDFETVKFKTTPKEKIKKAKAKIKKAVLKAKKK